MNIFDLIREEISELLALVAASERYCTTVFRFPEYITKETMQDEINRQTRIVEIKNKLGVR